MATTHGTFTGASVAAPPPTPPTQGVVFFFRSQDQAIGKPMVDPHATSPANLSGSPITSHNSDPDILYTQDFGFDIYRPQLYGNEPIITNSYPTKDMTINLTIRDEAATKRYDITRMFALKEIGTSASPTPYTNGYFVPRIMIMPNRTVEIYAKLLVADSLTAARTMRIEVSPAVSGGGMPQGITSIQQDVIFPITTVTPSDPTLFPIVPVTITTSGDDILSTITLTIVEIINSVRYERGKCEILPNKVHTPRVVFVNTSYNAISGAPSAITKSELNTRGLNQAAINLDYSTNPHPTLIIGTGDRLPEINSINQQQGPLANSLVSSASISANKRDDFLSLCRFKFYKEYIDDFLIGVENIYKGVTSFTFNGNVLGQIKIKTYTESQDPTTGNMVRVYGTEYPLLESTESLSSILDYIPPSGSGRKDYMNAVGYLYRFMSNNVYTANPIFLMTNCSTGGEALATINGKGMLVGNDVNDIMVIIHELGHNLGLTHTFKLNDDITEENKQINEALSALNDPNFTVQLNTAKTDVTDAKDKINVAVANGNTNLSTAATNITAAQTALISSETHLNTTITLLTKALTETTLTAPTRTQTINQAKAEANLALAKAELAWTSADDASYEVKGQINNNADPIHVAAEKAKQSIELYKRSIYASNRGKVQPIAMRTILFQAVTSTLENIMDYLMGTPPPRKDFVAFQWNIMREHAKEWRSNVADLDLSSRGYGGFSIFNNPPSNYLGSGLSDLHFLSEILISGLIEKKIEQINNTVVPNPNLDIYKMEINHEAMIAILIQELKRVLQNINNL